jgi:hypothetical protein
MLRLALSQVPGGATGPPIRPTAIPILQPDPILAVREHPASLSNADSQANPDGQANANGRASR